jgi:hypothetical protein
MRVGPLLQLSDTQQRLIGNPAVGTQPMLPYLFFWDTFSKSLMISKGAEIFLA